MKVSKELAAKAEEYMKLKNRVDKLYEELKKWVNENGFGDVYATGFGVSQEPQGDEYESGEYRDEYLIGEEKGCGTYYYPIEDSEKYLWVTYSF